jgi:hypothetical protein
MQGRQEAVGPPPTLPGYAACAARGAAPAFGLPGIFLAAKMRKAASVWVPPVSFGWFV